MLPEEKGWQAAAMAIEEGAPIDLGIPKPRAEWLMAGSAQSRTPVETLECSVQVGAQARYFLITGDREDNGIDMASPKPFTAMPLVWSRAFGGKDVAGNPIGKGVEKADGVVSLPNVTEKIGGSLLEKTPACPGSMPSLYRKHANLGTYDTAWLKKNWPGPPSDFDWSFFNLAQEPQRRDTYFVGNETIILTRLHPEHEVLQSALPGLRMRLFLNTGSEDEPLWQEVEAVADTVWLFPNQAVGMQLWHASCPTSDEKSSDISQVAALYESCEGPRKNLPELFADLESAQVAEIAAEEAPDIEEIAEEVAKNDPAASVPVAAMAMPTVEMPDVPQAQTPQVPDVPSLPDDPAEMLDVIRENAPQELPQLLEQINPALVEKGFEPLTVEQVLAQMDKQHEAMKNLLQAPEPTEAEILERAGISPKQFEDLKKATELTPPMRGNFVSTEAYEVALQAYGNEFAALTGASPKIRDQLVSRIRLLDEMQTNPAAAEALFPKAPDPGEILQKAGFNADVEKVKAAFASLDTMPPGDASMMSFMHEFGVALGVDPQIMTSQMTKHLSTMRSMAYKEARTQSALEMLFENFPEEQQFLPVFKQNIEAAKIGTSFDLRSLAQDSGISNPELLDAIMGIDPLPAAPLLPPAPENPAIEENAEQKDAEDELDASREETIVEETIEEDSGEEMPENEPVLDYTGQNLAGASFAGMALANARFDDANLVQADFSGANLVGASFANADLSNASLAGANLANADFTGARLEGANLSSCMAADATFDRAVFARTRLDDAILINASFSECAAAGTDFSGCKLACASFSRAALDKARFVGAMLFLTDFTACSLVGADFTRADMTSVRMYENTLDHCVFFKARAQESTWRRCHGKSQNLREAELAKANFDDCSLVYSDLGAIGARECRFRSCDLHGADLRFADLLNGSLRDCKLGDADLSWASLFACDLLYTAANEETNFESANIERTRLALGDL